MNTDIRQKAIDALHEFHAIIRIARQNAFFDHDGLVEVVGEHDGNDVAAQHLLIALNLLDNASMHARLAILSLGEVESK